jgi:hypothetical protein
LGATPLAVWHWILQVTGTANESGKWYAWWSGFGADLAEGAIFLSLVGLYHRHKCQSCWRPALKFGLGKVEGTHYETCHKHTNTADHEALMKQHALRHPALHERLNKDIA